MLLPSLPPSLFVHPSMSSIEMFYLSCPEIPVISTDQSNNLGSGLGAKKKEN